MSKYIAIFGATSGIGKLTMDEALSRGHRVRAFARSAADLPDQENMEKFPGDALSADNVSAVLQGVDAVVYCLGIKESVSMLWKEVRLFSDTTSVLLEEMPKAGVDRLVVVTGFGAGRSKQAMSLIERTGHRAILGRPYDDKDWQEAMLSQSDLRWTIARPVILTNGQRTGSFKVLRDPSEWRNGLIPRADVAVYLIDAVENDLDIQTDVVLSR